MVNMSTVTTVCFCMQAEFKTDYGDLPAKSEAELDAMVAETHHRMTHGESMPLAEEKKCLQHIKKLESAREKVCHWRRHRFLTLVAASFLTCVRPRFVLPMHVTASGSSCLPCVRTSAGTAQRV